MVPAIGKNRDVIAALCARYRAARVEVSDAVLRNDFRLDDSNMDLLVEFAPESRTHRLRSSSVCSMSCVRCSAAKSNS